MATTEKHRVGRKLSAPRNVAAKALRLGQFQPRVERNPDAYTRKQKHSKALSPPECRDDEQDLNES